MQYQLFHNPFSTTVRTGKLVGAHIVDRQITSTCERIPMRLLFQMEDNTGGEGPLQMFEHVISVRKIITPDGDVTLADLAASGSYSLPAGCKMLAVEFNTRAHSQDKWGVCQLNFGSVVKLQIKNLHQRFNKNTNSTFVDRMGRQVWHATYCYFTPVASIQHPSRKPAPVLAGMKSNVDFGGGFAIPLPF